MKVEQFKAIDLYCLVCIDVLACYIQVSICNSRLRRQHYGRSNTDSCKILIVDAPLYQMSARLLVFIC